MTLDMINQNETFTVTEISDENAKAQAIRLGIFQGASLKCSYKINKGPIIISNKGQEIALGYKLAKSISIKKKP